MKKGTDETEFERHMRFKNEQEQEKLRELKENVESEKRKQRATMSIEDLIKTEIHAKADEAA